jgi:hypothetical protein
MKILILTLMLSILAACTAQTQPPNRQLPILDASKGIVMGIDWSQTTPPPTTSKAIPPNRKKPVITRPGLVVGVRQTDTLGTHAEKDTQGVIETYLAFADMIFSDPRESHTQ